MTKSTITRERAQQIFLGNGPEPSASEERELARMALAAMDSEPVELPLDYLHGHKDGLEWAAQLAEANHPETGDWLYDDPIELAKAIRKGTDMPPVQPAADSEPVAWMHNNNDIGIPAITTSQKIGQYWMAEFKDVKPLYRHAQQPVVPDVMEPTIEAIKRILPTSNPDEYAACIGADMWNACRAAMLAAAPQLPGSEPAAVPGRWIPVSERMPENDVSVLTFDGMYKRVHHAMYGHWQCWEPEKITHWMPLPAAPQEVPDGK